MVVRRHFLKTFWFTGRVGSLETQRLLLGSRSIGGEVLAFCCWFTGPASAWSSMAILRFCFVAHLPEIW